MFLSVGFLMNEMLFSDNRMSVTVVAVYESAI